jgi:hypothetical protein
MRRRGNAALVNVFRSDGTAVTQDGVYGYGASYFGCCRRSYNVTYTTKAPYASANLKLGAASLGAPLRYDTVRAQGRSPERTWAAGAWARPAMTSTAMASRSATRKPAWR